MDGNCISFRLSVVVRRSDSVRAAHQTRSMPLVGKSMYVHEKRRRRHMPSRGFVDYRFGKAFGHQFDQLR